MTPIDRVIALARRIAELDGTDRLGLREPLAALDAQEPSEESAPSLDVAWKEAEAAVAAIGGWFIVTSYDDKPGIYTIEARRWVDPEPISEPARIFQQPLIPALQALVRALDAGRE